MNLAQCNLSVVPVRAEPSEKSEMISQLLFGERCEIHTSHSGWAHIRTLDDDYEGWCSLNQLSLMAADTAIEHTKRKKILVSQTGSVIEGSIEKLISFGSILHTEGQPTQAVLQPMEGRWREFPIRSSVTQLIEDAQLFMGTPYLWGGRSIFGLDCSGFIQILFKANGISLPRDARQQVHIGETINFREEAKAGDLLFFDNTEGDITHVGILIDGKNVIHASGFVRSDQADHYGIFNRDTGSYTHKLRIIKRITI